MAALLFQDMNVSVESRSSQSMTQLDYRRAVAEFDQLWETEADHDSEYRMIELLQQIEAYERTNGIGGK